MKHIGYIPTEGIGYKGKMAKSEPRRLIKFGKSSFVISLPKDWIEKNGLKGKDILYVEQNADGLTITSKEKRISAPKTNIIISTEGKDFTELRREFTSAYINNYNEIIFEGKDKKERLDIVKRAIHENIGVEIIEQTDAQTIVKDILDLDAISFEKLTRRMDNILRSMFLDLSTMLQSKEKGQVILDEINESDNEINKLYFLIWKIIRRCQEDHNVTEYLKVNTKTLSNMQWFSLHMEYLGDDVKRISKILCSSRVDDKSRKKVAGIIQLLEKDYLRAIGANYNNDKITARKIAGLRKFHHKLCSDLCKDYPSTSIISEKLRNIAVSIHNIAKIIAY